MRREAGRIERARRALGRRGARDCRACAERQITSAAPSAATDAVMPALLPRLPAPMRPTQPCAARPAARRGSCAMPSSPTLTIAHVDCDAFYASIEKRDDPALRDKPLIIGGGQRGVVSTCCYIARTYRRALGHADVQGARGSARTRRRHAEHGQIRRGQPRGPRADAGADAAGRAALDRRGLPRPRRHAAAARPAPARSLARFAQRVEREIGITVSVGLAHNKFLAKIASDLDKPRGFAVIGQAEARGVPRAQAGRASSSASARSRRRGSRATAIG